VVTVAAFVAMWVAPFRRFPTLGWLTGVFVGGFTSGLFGFGRRYRRW
jgi:ABC-type uncharacterized transport system permease subunit